MRFLLWIFILIITPVFVSGCPDLSVDYSLSPDRLQLQWDLDPEPFFYQVQIELIHNSTTVFRVVADNNSISLDRPPPGRYELSVLLLYPSCPASDRQFISIAPLAQVSYRSTTIRLKPIALWLFLTVAVVLCIILIIRR